MQSISTSRSLMPSIRVTEEYESPLTQLRHQAESARQAANNTSSSSSTLRSEPPSAPLQFNNFRNSSSSISTLASNFSSLTASSDDTYSRHRQGSDEFGRAESSPRDSETSRWSTWEYEGQLRESLGSLSGDQQRRWSQAEPSEEIYPEDGRATPLPPHVRSAATPNWDQHDPESIITFTPSSPENLSRTPSQSTMQSTTRSEIRRILKDPDSSAAPMVRNTPQVDHPIKRIVSSSGWESLQGDAGEDWEAAVNIEASRLRQAGIGHLSRPMDLPPISTSSVDLKVPPPRPSPGGRIYSGRAAAPPPSSTGSPAPSSGQSDSTTRSFGVLRPNLAQTQSSPVGNFPRQSPSSASSSQMKHASTISALSLYEVRTPVNAFFPSVNPHGPDPDSRNQRDSLLVGSYTRIPSSNPPASNPISLKPKSSGTLSVDRPLPPNNLASGITPAVLEADRYLDRGIELHAKAKDDDKRGDLAESSYYFRKAAEGGSTGGAVFYGLALRHGWGVQKDEKKGFQWLQHACEDLLSDTKGLDTRIDRGKNNAGFSQEIVMALYEVGMCYLDGLGVKADPKLALNYLRCAAKFGDLEAQEQLGFILSKGKPGVKKDLHEAAAWYRTAIAQGGASVGLSWIYKDKYLTSPK